MENHALEGRIDSLVLTTIPELQGNCVIGPGFRQYETGKFSPKYTFIIIPSNNGSTAPVEITFDGFTQLRAGDEVRVHVYKDRPKSAGKMELLRDNRIVETYVRQGYPILSR